MSSFNFLEASHLKTNRFGTWINEHFGQAKGRPCHFITRYQGEA
jgi:hypothetical protein